MSGIDPADFVAGDERTLRAAVEQYSPRLMPLVRAYGSDPDDAEDLMQLTWMRAYEKRATYAGGSLLGWLYSVCRSVCITRYRTARTRRDLLERLVNEPARLVVVEETPDVDSIVQAIEELPARQKDAVTYRLIEGRSTRETAELMGCAEGTVKALLHHGIQRLRSTISQEATNELR
jgi:RNA polymerase sigma-70 factor, ECF subfamily